MCTQKRFLLDLPTEEEALGLFTKSLGDVTNPELGEIANNVANLCALARLPLLIGIVDSCLRGKELYVWEDMRNQLSRLEGTELYEKVHKVTELSYENLHDAGAESVFLLCPLFRDSYIEIQNLLMYSVGLGLLKHTYTVEEARSALLINIGKLKGGGLLLDGGDKFGFVLINDVVRVGALKLARQKRVFVGPSEVRLPGFPNEDCTRISLHYRDNSEFRFPGVLECPEAEVFSLFANEEDFDIPSSFFEGALKLRVVDFTGVSFVSGLPLSLGFLRGLQTLCLQRCRFGNGGGIVVELEQLEVLSFAGSYIEELPWEIRGLTVSSC